MNDATKPALAIRTGAGPAGPRTEVLLGVEAMTTCYGDTVAVQNLSFEVHRGEFFTLLGPSGCGKSTTLMSIAGFERPTAGRVMLAGRDVTTDPPDRRGMGVVFQSYALFPHMSVMQNVMYPLRMRDVDSATATRRARDVLELVELDETLHHTRPAQLSGGQQQRVALARAMVFDPAVLLMDEPLAALDRRLRQTLQFQLRHLQARLETTVIYVTHDQEEALVLSDRIGVMRDGRFEQVAPPRELYERPRNAFVANFLGNSNRLPVAVEQREGTLATVRALGATGGGLQASCEELPSAEEEALLVIRPERVKIATGARADGGGGCAAVVQDVAFLGDHLRIETRILDEHVWTVRVAPDHDEVAELESGSPVRLSWRPEDARLLSLR